MIYQDVNKVVDVHLRTFPGFFLSCLGLDFLKTYYTGVCNAPENISFVNVDEKGNLHGFVAGAANPRGFYSRLLKTDWIKFCIASIGPVIRKPLIAVRLARALFYPKSNPIGDHVAGLFSIGVGPQIKNKGVGSKLIVAFLEESKKRGCRQVYLTTDRDNNESVNQFYRKNGFIVKRQYKTPEGRWMNEYWIDL